MVHPEQGRALDAQGVGADLAHLNTEIMRDGVVRVGTKP